MTEPTSPQRLRRCRFPPSLAPPEGDLKNKGSAEKDSQSRAVPDIAYLARRGGLSPATYPYKLAAEPFPYMAESCKDTSSCKGAVILGLRKSFEDLNEFRDTARKQGIALDEATEREHFPHLGFLSKLPTGNPAEAANAASEEIEERWPQLKGYPPKNIRRQGRPKDKFRTRYVQRVAEAIKLGKDPLEHLDASGSHGTPFAWRREGCPERFQDAVNQHRWKRRIQKWLSKIKKQALKTVTDCHFK